MEVDAYSRRKEILLGVGEGERERKREKLLEPQKNRDTQTTALPQGANSALGGVYSILCMLGLWTWPVKTHHGKGDALPTT